MYSFIHLFCKHILNSYYRPDSVLGTGRKNCQDCEASSKKFMQGDSQENTEVKNNNNKDITVCCEARCELQRKCGERNSSSGWGSQERLPRGETILS